jgi:ketosteroid isomerase-like protein
MKYPPTISTRRRVWQAIGVGLASIVPSAHFALAQSVGQREPTNEEVISEVYEVAEAPNLNADKFASLFADDGYFFDMSSGQRWTGQKVREPVTGLISAYPDMHRELLKFYSTADDVVVVELKLQGTHKGDLPLPGGVLRATGRKFDTPCCDVWKLKDGKVKSFHCYNNLVAVLKS